MKAASNQPSVLLRIPAVEQDFGHDHKHGSGRVFSAIAGHQADVGGLEPTRLPVLPKYLVCLQVAAYIGACIVGQRKQIMQPQFIYGKNPNPPAPTEIDLARRFDVYCGEYSHQPVVVYRNARFLGVKTLCKRSEHDYCSEFMELELANGQSAFLSRRTVLAFCEPGTECMPEFVLPKPI